MDIQSQLPMEFFTVCVDKFSLPELNSDYEEKSVILSHLCDSLTCVQLVGSYAEGLQLPPYFESGGSDYDMFLIVNNETPELRAIVEASDFEKMLIRTEEFPGYVSLVKDVNKYVTKDNLRTAAKDILESLFPEKALFTIGEDSKDSGPAITIEEGYSISYIEDTKFDFVPALKVNGWPQEAAKWVTRARKFEWPSLDLINGIVSAGFHLVNKHPETLGRSRVEDRELVSYWRLSFSLAEAILARSFNNTQRQCVILMKMFKEKLPGNIITTYHIKTLAYWIFESLPYSNFCKDNLGRLFFCMIDKLVHSLATKKLPHYFLDTVNLFSDITHDHLITVLKQVIFYRRHPLDVFKGSLTGGLTALSTSCMKDRKSNLKKLANLQPNTKHTDSRVLVYQRHCNAVLYPLLQDIGIIPNERVGNSDESDGSTETDFDEEVLHYLKDFSDNLQTEASTSDDYADLHLGMTNINTDLDMFYQLLKGKFNMLEETDSVMDHQAKPVHSEGLLEHLESVSVSQDDLKLLEQTGKADANQWLTLTFESHDFHSAVLSTLFELCSRDYSGFKIDLAIQGLLDGMQIFMEWAVSERIPRQEVVEYLDETYMTGFLQREVIPNISKLQKHWNKFVNDL